MQEQLMGWVERTLLITCSYGQFKDIEITTITKYHHESLLQ